MMNYSFDLFLQLKNLSLPFLPNNIAIQCVEFNIKHYQALFFADFNIALPQSILKSVNKRQAEFFAGRYAASFTFKKLNVPCKEIAIGEHRAPIFPNNTSASITHNNTMAICVAAHSAHYQFLGIDLEDVMSMKTMNDIKNTVIFNNELNILTQSTLSLEISFTLVFSAKESLFKALYPHVGDYFDFSAAKLMSISIQKQSFTLMLTKTLTNDLTEGMTFSGYFHQLNRQIITLIAV